MPCSKIAACFPLAITLNLLGGFLGNIFCHYQGLYTCPDDGSGEVAGGVLDVICRSQFSNVPTVGLSYVRTNHNGVEVCRSTWGGPLNTLSCRPLHFQSTLVASSPEPNGCCNLLGQSEGQFLVDITA